MKRLITLFIFLGAALFLKAQVWLEQTVIDTHVVATELEIPWQMDWLGTDEIIFSERTGAIKKVDLSTDVVTEIGVSTSTLALEQQAGLMGLQVHPNFPSTPYVYCAQASYSGTNIVIDLNRYSYDLVNDTLVFDSTLVSALPGSNTNIGGRLLISSDSYLYLTLGDAKNNESAQDLNSPNGKVHRFNLDGTIPSGNPFSGSSIYTYGHRNPQGLAEDNNGNIWISEHGPSSNDELNKLEAGGNYGWPLVLGSCNSSNQFICDSLNIIEPLLSFSPTIAPAGMCFFNESFIPEWENTFLIASLKEQRVMVEKMNETLSEVNFSTWVFQYQFGRIRDAFLSPTGRLFICTSNRDALGEPSAFDDKIVELIPSPHNSIAEIDEKADGFYIKENTILFQEEFSGTIEIYNLLGQRIWHSNGEYIQSAQLPILTENKAVIISITDDHSFAQSKLTYLQN